MTKIRDFEKSFYKFLKEDYADGHNYSVYYGNMSVDTDREDIWLYCNFSELNVDTGHFSSAYVDVITRIASVDSFNSQLTNIIDDLKEVFEDADISLYDFSDDENPVIQPGRKLLIRDAGRAVYERIEELEFEGSKTLLQANQMTLKIKLLENFARKRTV